MNGELVTRGLVTRVAPARSALAAFAVIAAACRAPLDKRISSIDPRAYVAETVEFVRANFYGERQLVEPLLAEASQRGERAQDLADAQATVRWLIKSLDDPHSHVIPPAEWAGLQGANVFATGVEVSHQPAGGWFVNRVHPDSPAARAGLARGMRVLGARGTTAAPTDAMAFRRLVEYGVGENGDIEPVSMWVQRGADGPVEVMEIDAECISVSVQPAGRVIEPGIAYLEIPTCLGWDSVGAEYAQRAHDEIRRLATTPSLRGWVLDLRRCRGGNALPILAAVAPFLGHGPVGGIATPKSDELFLYRDGMLWAGVRRMIRVERPVALVREVPLAILFGSETASGGEAAVVSLWEAPGAACFGKPTFGLTSSVTAKLLPDGALIQVASGWFMTNRLEVFDGPIAPRFEVETDWENFGGANDPALRAAVSWLLAQEHGRPGR